MSEKFKSRVDRVNKHTRVSPGVDEQCRTNQIFIEFSMKHSIVRRTMNTRSIV